MSIKIAFGMIVFEGDYVLESCLESVYPYASQILISEGPVKFWQERGRTTSTDKTNEILENFPDPENKITVVHGQFSEKDDQCNAYMSHINDDIDYVWNLDSDEVYKKKDIERNIVVKFPSSLLAVVPPLAFHCQATKLTLLLFDLPEPPCIVNPSLLKDFTWSLSL